MTNKISGYPNRPVQTGTDKTVSRTRETGVGAAESASSSKQAGAVHITGHARQLAALEQAIQAVPVVNEARVTEISQAIEDGSYQVAPERIADKLLQMNREL